MINVFRLIYCEFLSSFMAEIEMVLEKYSCNQLRVCLKFKDKDLELIIKLFEVGFKQKIFESLDGLRICDLKV